MTDVKRPAPLPLEYRYPSCTMCGEEVSHDGDSFYCEHCDAHWPDSHNDEGSWADESAEQCGSTHQPLAKNQFAEGKPYQFETKRCLLSADHKPPHRIDDLTTWTDETAVNGMGAR